MKGFEVIINDAETVNAAVSKGVVSALFEIDKDIISMAVTGLDLYGHMRWIEQELEIGDRIKLRVSEIEEPSPAKLNSVASIDKLKERYYQLKKELEDKGVI